LDTVVVGKPCFLLYNVLSKEECKWLKEASTKQGFEEAEKYCFMYRDRLNDRLMSDDEKFSAMLMERVGEHLPQCFSEKEVLSFGNRNFNAVRRNNNSNMSNNCWTLKDLNPRWRYCRYGPGNYFGPHTDGAWSPSNTETSFLTFMLYLDSPKDGDYEGGNTNFLTRSKQLKYSVVPEAGMALVFVQEDIDLYHEGAKLTKGIKHILRSDVMYKWSSPSNEELRKNNCVDLA